MNAAECIKFNKNSIIFMVYIYDKKRIITRRNGEAKEKKRKKMK
jgi:hypothetical protein